MLILINPMFSAELLNCDSNYVLMRQVVPHILEQRPDWLIEVIWPSNPEWKYYNDGFFDHPRIRRHPMFFSPNKMTDVAGFDSRAWERFLGYKGGYYDVIWNNKVEQGGRIRLYEPRYHVSAANVVVNFHHYVLHKSLPYPVEKVYEHVLMDQLTGSLPVHSNVVQSDYCLDMLMQNAEKYLAEDQVHRLAASVTKIPFGTLDKDLFARCQAEKHGKFTFVWNHRFQNYKRWREMFEVFDLLWKERQDFQVQVHQAAAYDAIKSIAPKPYVHVTNTIGKDHDAYLSELSRGHVCVTASIYETFCIAAVEAMALGLPLIAPDGVTFPEITGRTTTNKKYPFLYRNTTECLNHLRACLESPAMAAKWGESVKTYVWEEYDAEITASRFAAHFEELASVDVLSTLKRHEEWEKILRSKEVWPIDDLRAAAYRSANNEGGRLAADQSFPVVKIKRVANQFGFTDSWDKRGRLVLTKGGV